jgi:hypothetical protein
MGLFSRLVGAPQVGDVIQKTGAALDSIFTSKDEKLSHQEVLERIKQNPAEWQTKITMVEATHRSTFVAGWRPFIGWVGGASLACYFLPQYVIGSYMWAKLSLVAIDAGLTTLPPYPVSAEGLMELVLGMLGLGIMRSAEKVAGAAK